MNFLHTKKFRYGSVSVALTVVIIAAVILFNAIFTALSEKFTWYLDMTSEEMYTLSNEAKGLLDQVFYVLDENGERTAPRKHVDAVTGEEKDIEVTVIFCTPKDQMEAETTQRYVLYTVLEMAQEYPNINVKFIDYLTNPSAVSQYKESSGQSINAYSIIVTSGKQSRVYALSALFTTDSSTETVVGYNGEQRLVSAIHAVTQVQTPVACYTTGHHEEDTFVNSALHLLLYENGYDVQPINLLEQEIPADCTLIVIFNPTEDFQEKDLFHDVSELDKLERFMDNNHSVMYFFDYETKHMENLEAFLADWGVGIARHTNTETNVESNYLIKDTSEAYRMDPYANQAIYVEAGLGASLTRQLREAKNPKAVMFPYAGAIENTYDLTYNDEKGYYYGKYYENGVMRESFDVFTSSDSALAMAGEQTLDAKAPFSYMKVTRETIYREETNESTFSYLLACSSTDFVSAGALDVGNYGNHTVLTRACQELGGAQISVSLACKYFADMEINTITSKAANQYTVVLTVVPAAVIFIAGVYIMIRRKYA